METDLKAAKLVRTIRERLGLTQERFAARVGTMFLTINRWENGKSKPSPMAMKLLELLARAGEKVGIYAIAIAPEFKI